MTVLGGCTGGLTVLFFNKLALGQKWSYLLTLNGTLAGERMLLSHLHVHAHGGKIFEVS